MKVTVRNDSVMIEGYVNAIERNSKPLMSRIGQFIERICKGAFTKAINRNEEIFIMLNHDWDRILGSTKQGNLTLTEDSIGLRATATITDAEVIAKAKRGDLVGWSFGFNDIDVEQTFEAGYPLRKVKDLDLKEVSILDRSKSPAYEGTLITARSEEDMQFRSEAFMDEVELVDETREETQPEQAKPDKIDYSNYEEMIADMKGETK